MDSTILAVFIAYMGLVVAVGLWAARRSDTVAGFFLADRSLGAWVVGVSAAASSESGWLALGCVGMGFAEGVSALWIAVGCLGGFCFNWFVVAERLRRRSAELQALTVPDFLEAEVNDTTRTVRGVAVGVILLLMFTYVAAQLTAVGKAFDAMFNFPYAWGVVIGAAITIIYTTAGGFRAVSWTDVLQGLMMAAALTLLPVFLVVKLGGPSAFWAKLSAQEAGAAFNFTVEWPGERDKLQVRDLPLLVEPGQSPPVRLGEDDEQARAVVRRAVDRHTEEVVCKLDVREVEGADYEVTLLRAGSDMAARPARASYLYPGDRVSVGQVVLTVEGSTDLKGGGALASVTGGRASLAFLGFLIGMLGIGLGYPGTPHVITRFMAARSGREIRRGRAIALSWGALSLFGAIFLGMAVRCLAPDLADQEHGTLSISKRYLHPVLAGLVLAAVVSAVRSTIDSQLLVAASAVTRDTYEKLLGRELGERRMLRLSRAVVVVLGLAAIGLALMKVRLVFWFVLFSWAGLGAAFGPVVLLCLYWPRLTRQGALAGMLTGLGVVILWKVVLREFVAAACGVDIYELVPGFFLALGAAVVVSLAGRARES